VTDSIGHALKGFGIAPGDRVAIRIPNRPTFMGQTRTGFRRRNVKTGTLTRANNDTAHVAPVRHLTSRGEPVPG